MFERNIVWHWILFLCDCKKMALLVFSIQFMSSVSFSHNFIHIVFVISLSLNSAFVSIFIQNDEEKAMFHHDSMEDSHFIFIHFYDGCHCIQNESEQKAHAFHTCKPDWCAVCTFVSILKIHDRRTQRAHTRSRITSLRSHFPWCLFRVSLDIKI